MQSPKVLLSVALVVSAALAQEPSKPHIADISAIPSDSAKASGTCTASMSGYLLNKQGKKMTDSEVGKYLVSNIKNGYVISVYPETENGVFVDMKCITAKPNALARP